MTMGDNFTTRLIPDSTMTFSLFWMEKLDWLWRSKYLISCSVVNWTLFIFSTHVEFWTSLLEIHALGLSILNNMTPFCHSVLWNWWTCYNLSCPFLETILWSWTTWLDSTERLCEWAYLRDIFTKGFTKQPLEAICTLKLQNHVIFADSTFIWKWTTINMNGIAVHSSQPSPLILHLSMTSRTST